MRFVGYGPEDDEWLNVKESIRECSLGIDHSECQILKPGNLVVCFQVTAFPYFSCSCHDSYLLEPKLYSLRPFYLANKGIVCYNSRRRMILQSTMMLILLISKERCMMLGAADVIFIFGTTTIMSR